eukprot:jgi/Botrbrau1/12686/Bobra.67_1s0050.1
MILQTAIPTKGKRKRRCLEEICLAPNPIADNQLVRALASGDFHTRETALVGLTALLDQERIFSDEELLKIWKGLFSAFWHSDQMKVQEELATRLAGLVNSLRRDVGVEYFKAFMLTMRREWGLMIACEWTNTCC